MIHINLRREGTYARYVKADITRIGVGWDFARAFMIEQEIIEDAKKIGTGKCAEAAGSRVGQSDWFEPSQPYSFV
jgi:hypothetical protein